MRGNSGSVLAAIHDLGVVLYPANEHLLRARHTKETFEQHYQRAIPDRILNYMRGLSAEKARLFSADDVLLV